MAGGRAGGRLLAHARGGLRGAPPHPGAGQALRGRLPLGALALLAAAGCGRAAEPDAPPGRRVFLERRCDACHAVAGPTGREAPGPSLAGAGRRRTRDWLARYIRDPRAVDPHAKMDPVRGLSEADLAALLDYLAGL
ncbi:MAG: cytochrome c [Planctomycetales bacterium]|nr:cytochrome c [Planctomycetales bacterium]